MINKIGAVIEQKSDADPPVITQQRVDVIKAVVERNGSRMIDTAKITMPAGVRVKTNDIVSYIQDEVSLEFLTAIWNFQGSYRDESGFHHDGKINRSINGAGAGWTEIPSTTSFVNPNTTAGNTTRFRGNYGATFDAAGEEIRVVDNARLDFSQQFDIIIWFKNMQNASLSAPASGNPKMILFAKHDGTDGVEIGLEQTGSGTGRAWRIYAKLNGEEFLGDELYDSTDTTSRAATQDIGLIDHRDEPNGTSSNGRPRMIRFYRDHEDVVKLSLDGLVDGNDGSTPCRQVVASTQSSTRTTAPLYIGTNKANVDGTVTDNFDFVGHIFQIRVYCGGYLNEVDAEMLRIANAQPMTMKISGTVWQRNDRIDRTEVSVLSSAKSLLDAQINSTLIPDNLTSANADTEPATHNKNLFSTGQEVRNIVQTMIYNLDSNFIFKRFGDNGQTVSGNYLAVGGFIPNLEILMLISNQQFLTLPTKTFLYEYGDENNNMKTGYIFDSKDFVMTERGEDDIKIVNDLEVFGDLMKVRAPPLKLGQIPASLSPDPYPMSVTFIRPPINPITISTGTTSAASTDPNDIVSPSKYRIIPETKTLYLTNLPGLSSSDYLWATQYHYELTTDVSGAQGGTGDDVRHDKRQTATSITKYGMHSRRLYIPQLLKKVDFSSFSQYFLGEWEEEKRRYTVIAPFLINSLRENHIIQLKSDVMKFPDSSGSTTTYETVRSIKWQFPECITTIEVGDHLYDSFDIIKGTRDTTSHLTVGAMETRVDTA